MVLLLFIQLMCCSFIQNSFNSISLKQKGIYYLEMQCILRMVILTVEYFLDSSISVDYSRVITKNYNASTNNGVGEALGVRYIVSSEGQCVKLMQILVAYYSGDIFWIDVDSDIEFNGFTPSLLQTEYYE